MIAVVLMVAVLLVVGADTTGPVTIDIDTVPNAVPLRRPDERSRGPPPTRCDLPGRRSCSPVLSDPERSHAVPKVFIATPSAGLAPDRSLTDNHQSTRPNQEDVTESEHRDFS